MEKEETQNSTSTKQNQDKINETEKADERLNTEDNIETKEKITKITDYDLQEFDRQEKIKNMKLICWL